MKIVDDLGDLLPEVKINRGSSGSLCYFVRPTRLWKFMNAVVFYSFRFFSVIYADSMRAGECVHAQRVLIEKK